MADAAAPVIYVLCALTSLGCAVLLGRAYLRTKAAVLLWSGLCFLGLTLNNLLLCMDLLVFTTIDLSLLRSVSGLVSLALLVFGLVWSTD